MGDTPKEMDKIQTPVNSTESSLMQGSPSEASSESANAERRSIQILKETKELADITNMDNLEPSIIDIEERNESNSSSIKPRTQEKNIEMVFENVGMDKTMSSTTPLEAVPDPPHELSTTIQSAESGRMNKLRDQSSNIFPVGTMGCKEEVSKMSSPRRFLDAHEASKDNIGHIENTPRKMPSASKSDHNRNPLTGTGLEGVEMKKSGSNRKVDGNPVLGVGYEKKSSSSSTRIPPGGFSHGLW